MEHPVREIASVITTLTTGSPQQQQDTLNEYFLPDASFSHPFCHVPSFNKGTIPFAPNTNSLWVLLCIYRWYRTLSPNIDISIDSAVFDQRTGLLYVNIHQNFSVFFIPFYSIRVRLVTVLHLKQRTSWSSDETVSRSTVTESREPAPLSGPGQERAKYFIASQEDFYQMNDCVQFLVPRVGQYFWLVWQLFSTWLCVVGAVLLLPVYYLMNGNKTAKKVA
ncbi:hypothetical protein QQS21_000548 [Conoideocrella luteorostrata]|uniref:SigF-like NTF2-like domain-containing protein n=1 Tax=Conoideocrella luteorostrata TaxID=1105319 RepID=A0AAJ0FZ44_9HYPO|nr:hypothetical protein QQS21_000548 [Conoideocrella luteorostrata]